MVDTAMIVWSAVAAAYGASAWKLARTGRRDPAPRPVTRLRAIPGGMATTAPDHVTRPRSVARTARG